MIAWGHRDPSFLPVAHLDRQSQSAARLSFHNARDERLPDVQVLVDDVGDLKSTAYASCYNSDSEKRTRYRNTRKCEADSVLMTTLCNLL